MKLVATLLGVTLLLASNVQAETASKNTFREMLLLLSHGTPVPWDTLQTIPGLKDIRPGDGGGLDTTKWGRMTLAGLPDTKLPNGKVGAEADVRDGNEGDSGANFTGKDAGYSQVTVRKFYPDKDVLAVLRKQLQPGDKVLVDPDNTCQPVDEDDTGIDAAFYVELQGGEFPVWVRAKTDLDTGKYNPGYTDYTASTSSAKSRAADWTECP